MISNATATPLFAHTSQINALPAQVDQPINPDAARVFLTSRLQADDDREFAQHALNTLSTENLVWLAQFLMGEYAALAPHLNTFLTSGVTNQPYAQELLIQHRQHRPLLMPLMTWWPIHKMSVLEAYMDRAPQWLSSQQSALRAVPPTTVADVVDKAFGLVLRNPEVAAVLLSKYAQCASDTLVFEKNHLCEPTATMYIRTKAARSTTPFLEFDELMARSPFVRCAARERPHQFNTSPRGNPITPGASLGPPKPPTG